jgi:thiamine kinase-like enzyme
MSFPFFLLLFGYLSAADITTATDTDRIYRAVQYVPEWKNENLSISPLEGGLTNPNYKVYINGIPYFFRLGIVQNTLLNTSLEMEYATSMAAGAAGIAPKIISYCPQEGVLVSEFIETAVSKIDVRNLDQQRRYCATIRSLHSLKATFPRKLCPYETIELYRKNAIEIGASLPKFVEEAILPLIHQIRSTLDDKVSFVPCHNDLHSGNFLDDGIFVWLIDWEYAAMGDPLFDLATLPSVEGFSDSEMEALLRTYLGQDSLSKEEIRSFLFKCALSDVRWGLWCYLQDKSSLIEYDFIELGEYFLNKALLRLRSLL